jgi:hypothetical protein
MSNKLKGYLDIYRDGLFARALGRLWTENPYPFESDAFAFWFAGWTLVDQDNDDTAPKDDYEDV